MRFPAIPFFNNPNRLSAKPKLRRTRRSSWTPSGWFEPIDLPPNGGGTAIMTLGCPDDFVAVRLGFPNVSRSPWRITRAIARPSSTFNDYVTPTGNAAWTAFTTVNGGNDRAEVVANQAAPTEIVVRALDDTPLSQAARVAWTWTDWISVRSLPPDPATRLRVLMLRALLPSCQAITYANGQLRHFTGNSRVNRGFDLLVGGLKFNIDQVTEPDCHQPLPMRTWTDNHLAPGTIFPMVQFLTHKPGVAGLVTGDSHAQGTSTTDQFSGFSLSATARLRQDHSPAISFSMVNCAVGGLCSGVFFARLEQLVHAVRPSFAVLPGWTFNDETDGVNADQAAVDIFLARLLSTTELCDANGIVPVILTPFPRNPSDMTAATLATWRMLRTTLLDLRIAGAVVIDATSILGRKQGRDFDGAYRPSMTDDQMHPNNDGHEAVGQALANTVATIL